MKQTLIALLIFSAMFCEAQRVYKDCYYNVSLNNQEETSYRDIKVFWRNNDASDIDNLDAIVYPDGHILIKNEIKPYMKLDNGDPVFSTYVKDEGGRGVILYISRYSERHLGFLVYYSKKLSYAFKIDLYDFKNID